MVVSRTAHRRCYEPRLRAIRMAAARPRIEFGCLSLLVADEPGSGIPGSH